MYLASLFSFQFLAFRGHCLNPVCGLASQELSEKDSKLCSAISFQGNSDSPDCGEDHVAVDHAGHLPLLIHVGASAQSDAA